MQNQNSSANRLVEANIHLQDINKMLDNENRELKSYLLRCYNLMKNDTEKIEVYFLVKDIKEMLHL